jgi:hypothetical protein
VERENSLCTMGGNGILFLFAAATVENTMTGYSKD